jgi:alpha-glucosidase
MVTEAYPEGHNPLAAYLAFYVGVDPRVAAPFNFEGVQLPWEAAPWNRFLRSFHLALKQFSTLCVPSYAFGNHDKPRLIDRLGDEDAARSAAVMLLTLPGMVFVYYGEEIGMHDVDIPEEFVQDPAAKGDPLKGIGRDPERTPMQWSDGPNAGFSDGESTWLPVSPDYAERNVDVQSSDAGSYLSLYRSLGKLRAGSMAMKSGELKTVKTYTRDVLGYLRFTESEAYLVLVNFSNSERTCHMLETPRELILSSVPDTSLGAGTQTGEEILLAPYEAAVFSVDPEQCTLWP